MWGTLALIGLQIGLSAYLYFTRDDEKEAEESGEKSKRGSTTVAEEGNYVGMVLGTCRVNKTNIIQYPFKGPFRDYLAEKKEGFADFSKDARKDISVQVVLGVTARSHNTAHLNEFRKLWIGEALVSDRPRELNPQAPTDWTVGYFPKLTYGYDVVYQPLWGGINFGGGIGHEAEFAPGSFAPSPDDAGGRIWTMPGDADEAESGQQGTITYQSRGLAGDPTTGPWDLDLANHYGAVPGVMKLLLWYFKIGEAASMPGFSAEVRCKPQYNGLSPISIESSVASIANATENVLESNPAACLYHVLTDDWTGIGLDPDKIDVQSFHDVALVLYTEGNGFSMHIENSSKASKIIKEIIKQIDGVLYADPIDQRLTLALVREDYTVGTLPLFDDSNVVKVASYKETSWADTYNEVRVTYEDRIAEYEEKYAVAQDSANALANGRIKSIAVNFPGVKVASTANRMAARELQFYATPQTHVTLHINRQGATFTPGSVFRWSNAAYEITDMVLRIHKLSLSETDDGVIVVECTRDKYSDIASIFDDPDHNWWDDLGIRPQAPGCYVVQEVPPVPPFNSGSNWESPIFGGVVVNASPLPSGGGGTTEPGGSLSGSSSLISVNDLGLIASAGEERSSTPCGTVGVAYSTAPGVSYYYDTGGIGLDVTFYSPVDFVKDWTEEEVRAGRAILSIGDEYLSYETFVDTDAPTYRSSVQTETAVSQTSISITLPAGVVDDDLLVAMINLGTAGLSTTPAGWAHVQGSPYVNTGGGTDNNFVVMTKVAASETGPYVWTRDAADLMEIQGSVHAFSNATLENATMSAYYDTLPTGVNKRMYAAGNTSAELVVTGIAISDSWWSGSSLILPTDGFTEIDDSATAIDGHMQVQYGPVPINDGSDRLDSIIVDLNLAGVTPTSAFTTVVLALKGPSTRSYKLTNVWRGLFDTLPVDHAVGEPVFFVSEADISKTITNRDFSCASETVIRHQTAIGVRATFKAPTLDAGLVLTRRSERPARPTSFVLRNDGADAAASGPEFDYAYNADDTREITNASVIGVDTKVSSAGVYGDVWSNDLRATWNRRPKLVSCEGSVVRGDDPDAPYGKDENTSLCVEAKGDQESAWAAIAQKDVKGDVIRSNTEFVDMSQAKSGAGSLRLCAVGDSPVNGESLTSREAESVTVDVHTSRQLLINPNFVPYWDVDSDSSVASGKGDVLPGNPVYSARGWRNVTSGAGRPRYKVPASTLIQGADTAGFAFSGEFIDGENVTIEQVVAVPYLDTEGSEINLAWYFANTVGDELSGWGAIIETLDVNGVVLNTVSAGATPGNAAGAWDRYDLTLSAISAAARSIRVTLALHSIGGTAAISKASMVMGRAIATDQLLDSDFDALTNWTSVGWTSVASDGALVPVSAQSTSFALAPTTGTTGTLEQDVTIPAAYGTGDYVRLQWWGASTGPDDTIGCTLAVLDGASGTVASHNIPGIANANEDQWYFHEQYVKIPGEAVTVRVSFKSTQVAGAMEVAVDDADLTFIKGGHS